MVKQNIKYIDRSVVLLDGLLIAASLAAAYFIRFKSGLIVVDKSYLPFEVYMRPLIYLIPIYLILYRWEEIHQSYRRKRLLDEFIGIVQINIIGVLVFFTVLFILKELNYSRIVLLIFSIINIVVLVVERIMLRLVLKKYRKTQTSRKRQVVLVGISEISVSYIKKFYRYYEWNYEIQGIFDQHSKRNMITIDRNVIKVLGKIDKLGTYLENNKVDELIITLGLNDYSILEKVVNIAEKYGVFTKIIPAYNKVIPARPRIEEVDGLTMISIRNIPLNDVLNKAFKRLVDLVGAFVGMIICLPIFLVVAIMIKIQSKGPVIFKQTRVGLNKKEFTMYKFRSMVVQSRKKEKRAWTVENDPRVTRIGQFMRKTNIDELPQLLNVLKGDMSLIGPRPERPQFVEKFKEQIPKYMVKHQVRPGMTGWAQIKGLRGDTSIRKRIECDLYYIENWSLKLDVRILFMTFWIWKKDGKINE